MACVRVVAGGRAEEIAEVLAQDLQVRRDGVCVCCCCTCCLPAVHVHVKGCALAACNLLHTQLMAALAAACLRLLPFLLRTRVPPTTATHIAGMHPTCLAC